MKALGALEGVWTRRSRTRKTPASLLGSSEAVLDSPERFRYHFASSQSGGAHCVAVLELGNLPGSLRLFGWGVFRVSGLLVIDAESQGFEETPIAAERPTALPDGLRLDGLQPQACTGIYRPVYQETRHKETWRQRNLDTANWETRNLKI